MQWSSSFAAATSVASPTEITKMASNVQNDMHSSHLTNHDGQMFVNTTVVTSGGNVYLGRKSF